MDAPASNPLISSQTSSQLQAVLHPLVLLTISDYITRHTLRQQAGPVVGALLGQQNGREITIEHAFDCHMQPSPQASGGYLLDSDKFAARLDQMVTVHKERQLDFVGWYTLLPLAGPTSAVVPIHNQILEGWNESAVLLGFHPDGVLNHSVGGKLPLTIYESNYEVDDQRPSDHDSEDKRMDDGEAPPLKLRFREVPYSVETDETEMISMNYVAAGAGTAGAASASTPAAANAREERQARSIEATGKGKRRLVEAQGDEPGDQPAAEDEPGADLTREEDEMVAALTARINAVKMLHSRIRLLTTYLERLPPSFVTGDLRTAPDSQSMDTDHAVPSLPILRQIQALVHRLGLVMTPLNQEAFDEEMLQERNNVDLVDLLNSVMQTLGGARDAGRKLNVIETAKALRGRGGGDASYLASPGYNMSGAGDILI
ncbi:uncharacterized protein UV8b_05814 [Ustilaginoidea virens]|uniref:COP9 signalosome complex subunit 6 n=1 Tax=Ustilaginoidea virens TaxID=1159556 RepID=A0A8E5MJ12_USTVR|nr:uncharacterized protein UV8b_05814 [Ustilaginoidea virens]QUC21571.1 hypothetical protein UV8b_05814 [Ustilaginoidea virens]